MGYDSKIDYIYFPVVSNYSKSTNKITHKEILMPIRINKKITKAKNKFFELINVLINVRKVAKIGSLFLFSIPHETIWQ